MPTIMPTEKQILLTQCCKAYGMDRENAFGVMLLLQNEADQDKMLEWMRNHTTASQEEVLSAALQLTESN